MDSGRHIPESQNLIDILNCVERLKEMTGDKDVRIVFQGSDAPSQMYSFGITWWVEELRHKFVMTLDRNELDSVNFSMLDLIEKLFAERYAQMSKYELQTGSKTCLLCGEVVIGEPTAHFQTENHLNHLRKFSKTEEDNA